MVITARREVLTSGQGDAHDITPLVADLLAGSTVSAGVAVVSVVGSTAGITTIEFESGVLADLTGVLERLAPRDAEYRHHLRWGDDNGSSHLRAALVGPALSIPFADRKLLLGTWQQIVLLEFDTRARRREIVVQLVGE
jgi:secondary thiamine-phosphate synthase enzyme